jgi:cell division protein FtsQ
MSSSDRRSSSSGSNRRPTRRATSRQSSGARGTSRGSAQASRPVRTRAAQPQPSRSKRGDVDRVGRLAVDGLGLKNRAKKEKPRWLVVVLGVAGGVLAIALLAFVLSFTPLFAVTNVVGEGTDHVTSTDIVNLAAVGDGTTLLNVNTAQIEENIKKNPWVATVSVKRKFPNTLEISVTEQQAFAIVVSGSADKAWYISGDGTWIQPVSLQTSGDTTLAALALDRANKEGLVLIQNVSSSLNPVAGETTDDTGILAAIEYQDTFSEGLRDQIVSYSAASAEALSCTLKSGIEVSLGSPTNISLKESVITALMAEYPNQLTYINVRIPSKPTYRKIDSDSVQEGTGVQTDVVEDAAQAAEAAGDDADATDGDATDDSATTAAATDVSAVTEDEITE